MLVQVGRGSGSLGHSSQLFLMEMCTAEVVAPVNGQFCGDCLYQFLYGSIILCGVKDFYYINVLRLNHSFSIYKIAKNIYFLVYR